MPQVYRSVRRSTLRLEELEPRLALDATGDVRVGVASVFGPQIVTVQGYQDSSGTRIHFGIFDTGAGAITFSERDQALFTTQGMPIPIQIPGGASAQGIGGAVVGDLSQPGIIWADGLQAANMTVNALGVPEFSPAFTSRSAEVPNIQSFVGTPTSSLVPTITGTPILLPSPAHPKGLAAEVSLQGFSLSLAGWTPQTGTSIPSISFVDPGATFGSGSPQVLGPFQIPVSLSGGGDPIVSGAVTEAPVPVINGVTVSTAQASVSGQRFLLDTGAQLSVISPATAAALGLDLQHPSFYSSIEGIGGSEQVPGFNLSEIDVPDIGGTLHFMGGTVFVANVGNGLGGVLGMNVLDSAAAMIYDPYGPAGPMLTLAFNQPVPPPAPRPGTDAPTTGGSSGGSTTGLTNGPTGGSTPSGAPSLPFQDAITGQNLPLFQVDSGRISGQVFVDFNHNGVRDSNEPALSGQTVYIDRNNDGQLDSGDPVVTTDANGFYQFTDLTPGLYNVREVVSPALAVLSGMANSASVVVQNGATASGIDFGNAQRQPDAQTAFVASVYGDVLDRAPDVGGLNYFIQLLHQGTPHDRIAQLIWESPEHRGIQVDQYYQALLHRSSDAAGRAYWISLFLSGASETNVQTAFLMSGEYQAAHASNSAFLVGLYNDVLGRAIDPVGLTAWAQALQRGETRAQVIQQILNSDEFNLRVIDSFYAMLLHRPADSGGRQAWLYLLQHGQEAFDGVAEAFLGSPEYANWSGQLSSF